MAMILAIRRHQDCSLDNVPERSNFHDYVVLRIDQMPRVEVHIVNSAQPPTGVGEPATPVIAPAVANALFSVPDSALTACR
jgi:isoquinoline 1-oxidoreductase subunit beta